MEERANIKGIAVVLTFIIGVYALGWVMGRAAASRHTEEVSDTTYSVVYDTIPYYQPVPRDSVVIRYETHVLALAPVSSTEDADSVPGGIPDENMPDSASVVIPITQKVYTDSTYTAYVSGFNPSLDSIFIYQPTFTYNIVTRIREKPKRFGIGPQIGVGVGKDGNVTPYIGIGIHYDLWNF